MQTNHRCTRFVAVAVVFYGLLVLSEQFRFSNHASAQMYEGDSCESMNDLPGTCMEPQKCTWVQQNVIRKRQYSIYDVPICGFTVRASLICCPDESEIRRTLVGKADQACQNFARGSAFFAPHIVEGNEAEFGEIPFIVALGYNSTDSDKEYDFRCGASWIAKNFLLTAAHCVSGRNQPSIARIGTLNLTESDASNFQDSKIKDCYPHPRYKPKLKYHDIALIELVTPFKYDDDGIVNKICLYTDPGDMDPRHVLTASGWGMTTAGGSTSDVLLKVDLNTEPLERCTKDYRTNAGHFRHKLPSGVTDRQYCAIGKLGASGDRGDACVGDSGGPLHFRNLSADRFYLVGISSFGLGCGSDSASIYTRVAAYLDWIVPIVWPDQASLLDDE
uniref:Putative trypsin-like serine protease n=1 Tax=Aedes albopictus TaxID=7160 RepID=A0A1W7R7V7_AEDAL